ncbi:hypothetical protein [Jannaschia sp. LMIT008]|uniref:hypothetical protein n=1 Tax=Jannaschia maritima TaxID=3032585 RepID=UPI0028121417|nr:hypothetical protein [Jannaschia sp. LMIT008]
MEPLIERFGSQANAYRAVLSAAQAALDEGRLNRTSRGHVDETLLNVDGIDVYTIGGLVRDGRLTSINASRRKVSDP